MKGHLEYLWKLPASVLAKKAARVLKNGLKRNQVNYHSTEFRNVIDSPPHIICSYLTLPDLRLNALSDSVISYLSEKYLSHKFNILGSGWVSAAYDCDALGLENYLYQMNLEIDRSYSNSNWLPRLVAKSHLKLSVEYFSKIFETNPDYIPIDWQKDHKSGFRWTAQQPFNKQIALSKGKLGADIKIPWELSRMQHLPQLAIFASKKPEIREQCLMEFKCQCLDFFASNPIGMGVNFACAMDVGIRAANMLLAYDLFKQLDDSYQLDKEFDQIFVINLYLHGKHILSDLEYRDGLTSNHYLANIAGLLFIAAYLPENQEINQWLAFSIQELINCLDRQFFDDGSNFEGSTSYHRLSSEMMQYGASLILGLPPSKRKALKNYAIEPWSYQAPLNRLEHQQFDPEIETILPKNFFQKLWRAGIFTKLITKPTGEVPQFGDNDSGRFFRFSPNGRMLSNREAVSTYKNLKNYLKVNQPDELFWDENDLNHKTFLAACYGLFNDKAFIESAELFPLEHSIVRSIVKNNKPDFKNDLSYLKDSKQKTSLDLADFPFNEKTLFEAKNKDAKGMLENFAEHTIISPSRPPASWRGGVRHPNHFLGGNSPPLEGLGEASELQEAKKPNASDSKPLTEGLKFYHFPDFQLYLFTSDRLYLSISGISNIRQHHSWGHVHNDKLSFELNIDGEDLVVDPGTYLYTPIPTRRNEFRKTASHSTLIVEGKEQNPPLSGAFALFNLKRKSKVQLVEVGDNFIRLLLEYGKVRQIREFHIHENSVEIIDYSNVPFKTHFNQFHIYSNGYGKRIN